MNVVNLTDISKLSKFLPKLADAAISAIPTFSDRLINKSSQKFESLHPYDNNSSGVMNIPVKIRGAKQLIITFDPRTNTNSNDSFRIYT